MPLAEELQEDLSLALHRLQIRVGSEILDEAEPELDRLGPETPNAASLLLLLAQWVDVGYRDCTLLESLLLRFPPGTRSRLAVGDYLRLRMVEAFCALSTGDPGTAIEILDLILKTQRDIPDDSVAALAHFWKGRAHRKKGEYETSLQHIVCARELAQNLHDETFTAAIQIQESWLLFQRGLSSDAQRLLAQSEAVLQETDHYVALGNIESARGRIVRRAGEYSAALEHFACAISIYARADVHHKNLARALVNAAYVRRLLALQLRRRIDRYAESGRNRPAAARGGSSSVRDSLRSRYQELSCKAIADLNRARQIYAIHRHSDGIGNVALNLGYLHLDGGDIDQACVEASEAYGIGLQQADRILMARARILQSAIENAHVEEQTGEDVDIAVHANHARQYSEEAVALARQTQNRRLVAGACIACGMTAANEFFLEWEVARKCAREATELIGPAENDHLTDDLALLKTRIVQASGINDTLRGWSEGMVGNKSFQQVTEEFAEIVIPKVWLREDKKISRVAAALSISPKKVRRILRNAGSVGSS